MSSPCRTSLIAMGVFAAAVLLTGCDREERQSRGKPLGQTVPLGAESGPISPGERPRYSTDPRAAAYEQNAQALAEGQQLFMTMNCVGCHSHGGGGMGPALIDDEWRYGGRMDQIAETIANGRPNGMPRFRDRLTADQIWQLSAYVRSLSGQVRKDAVSSRADEMSILPPQTETRREPQRPENVIDR